MQKVQRDMEQQSIEEQEYLRQYDDKTLTTPEHDKLLIQLMNKDYVRKLFPELKDDKITIEVCKPIENNTGDIVGYADVIIETETIKLCIEVKPWITSFRNIMRQLKIYKRYTTPTKVCLYTRDLQYKQQIESQGIRVI